MRLRPPSKVLFPILAAVLAGAVAPPAPAHAQAQDDRTRYADCLALAKVRPDHALEEAGSWEALGGGDAARHCKAVALIGMGEPGEAATRLEALASQGQAKAPQVRVGLLAQAGQAWLIAGEPAKAEAAQTTALRLAESPTGGMAPMTQLVPDLLIDRAITYATLGNDGAALQDLNRVLDYSPGQAEALALRATARRRLGNLPGAAMDSEQAVQLAPNNAEAWLERGDTLGALGRSDEARAAWIRVLELAPASAAADSARARIEDLDVTIE